MRDEPSTRRAAEPVRGAFLPCLLLALALVVWLAFQAYQLLTERQQLKVLRLNQETAMETATKLRGSLDAVATRTARLAGEGNANARVIVEELRKRGVTINPNDAAKAN
ncbi:MAG: hypothetical protein V4540_17570 [Pseudomonadota bacterium]